MSFLTRRQALRMLAIGCASSPLAAATSALGRPTPSQKPIRSNSSCMTSNRFKVQGNSLVLETGEPLVLKGINHMFLWTDPEGKAIPEMARTGANAVRIVWERYGSVESLRALMCAVRDHGMIPIPELHDGTTAGLKDWGWSLLEELVDWWVSAEVRACLQPL